jgi:predicted ester cyclase
MGMFGKFFKKSSPKKTPLTTTPEKPVFDDASAGTASSNSLPKLGKKMKTKTPPALSANASTVKTFLDLLNSKDLDKVRSMITYDLSCEWEEQCMRFEDFLDVLESVWKSFPDFNLVYKNLVDGKKANVVVVHDCVPSGTHTGEPFGFGPYDPIEASGTRVENAAETITVHLTEDGKICKWLVKVNGTLTGPAGMYAQLPGGFPCM